MAIFGKNNSAKDENFDEEVAQVIDEAEAALEDEETPVASPEEGDAPEAQAETDAKPSEDEIALAKAEVKAWQDKYLRLQAEWDNYRRRTAEQRVQERAQAAEKLVGSLIPVVDDLERTIDYAEKNGTENLLGGVEAVHSKFVSVLEKDGVEVISPAGQPFNALEAQAVAMVQNAELFDETVVDVYQKGYKMGTKVIRPAMVTVSTGGPKREPEDQGEDEE